MGLEMGNYLVVLGLFVGLGNDVFKFVFCLLIERVGEIAEGFLCFSFLLLRRFSRWFFLLNCFS